MRAGLPVSAPGKNEWLPATLEKAAVSPTKGGRVTPLALPVVAVAVGGVVVRLVVNQTSGVRVAAVLLFLAWLILLVTAGLVSFPRLMAAFVIGIPLLNTMLVSGRNQVGPLILAPATVALAGVLLAGFVLGTKASRAPGPRPARRVWILMLLIGLSSLVATITSPPSLAVPSSYRLSLWLDGVLLPGVLMLQWLKWPKRRVDAQLVAKAIVVSSALAVVFGFVLNSFLYTTGTNPYPTNDPLLFASLLRLQATFTYGNPNTYGLVAALTLPICAAIIVRSTGYRRLVWFGFFSIILAGGIYTFSRGALLAMALSIIGMGVLSPRFRKLSVLVILIMGMGVVLAPFASSVVTARFVQPNLAQTGSIVDRFAAIRISLEALSRYPLGVGGGGFSEVWTAFGGPGPVTLQSPHNIFLAVALEYGLVAGVSFLLLVASAIRRALEEYRVGADPLILGLCLGLLGFVVAGTLSGAEMAHLYGVTPLSTQTYLFVMVLALTFQLTDRTQPPGPPNDAPHFLRRSIFHIPRELELRASPTR